MTTAEIHQQVKQYFEQFGPVSEEVLMDLVSIAYAQTVKKDEYLLHAGDVAKRAYLVCSGILIATFVGKEGVAHIKNFFVMGSLAGSTVSLIHGTPSNFSIACVAAAQVISFDYAQFRERLFRYESLQRYYIAYLEDIWITKNEARQIAFATASATERYLTFRQQFPSLENQVSQKLIASYLGITPTQLSRIRKKL